MSFLFRLLALIQQQAQAGRTGFGQVTVQSKVIGWKFLWRLSKKSMGTEFFLFEHEIGSRQVGY